jgi:hypothetical protein
MKIQSSVRMEKFEVPQSNQKESTDQKSRVKQSSFEILKAI